MRHPVVHFLLLLLLLLFVSLMALAMILSMAPRRIFENKVRCCPKFLMAFEKKRWIWTRHSTIPLCLRLWNNLCWRVLLQLSELSFFEAFGLRRRCCCRYRRRHFRWICFCRLPRVEADSKCVRARQTTASTTFSPRLFSSCPLCFQKEE